MQGRYSLDEFNKLSGVSVPEKNIPLEVIGLYYEIKEVVANIYGKYFDVDVEEPPRIIWHYTSTKSLHSIICSNKFYLGEATHMNDPKEGVLLMDSLKEMADKKSDFFLNEVLDIIENYYSGASDPEGVKALLESAGFKFNPYLASFSNNNSSLEQWRLYADDSYGVAIGVDTDLLMNYLMENHDVSLVCVHYNDEKIMECARDIVEGILDCKITVDSFTGGLENFSSIYLNGVIKESFITAIESLRYFFKHEAYCYEKEWRIIKAPQTGGYGNYEYIVRRDSIHESFVLEGSSFEDGILPIREVCFGPMHDEKATRRFIKSGNHLYREVECSKVDIPYRG